MSNRKVLMLASVLLLSMSGCATVEPVPLPDGRTGYVIDGCDNLAECYRKAAETCGGRYEVLQQSSQSISVLAGATIVPVPEHAMTIDCPGSN